MMNNDNSKEKTKEKFSAFWQKTAEGAKKAAEGAKVFAEQTKKSIHEQQAKKYITVTKTEFESKDFQIPSVIQIVDNSACREFVIVSDAIGWIERHKEVDVLHMYADFVKKCNLTFVPLPQQDHVYCADHFDEGKYIDSNEVFGKASQEKMAELRNIAYVLGAKSCSVEIVEAENEETSRSVKISAGQGKGDVGYSFVNGNMQSGKTNSSFEGHDHPTYPELKWFAYDPNIKGLIEMRCNWAIKSDSIKLQGSSSAAMSLKVACAIDQLLNVKGSASMEKQMVKEYNKTLIFEIEF